MDGILHNGLHKKTCMLILVLISIPFLTKPKKGSTSKSKLSILGVGSLFFLFKIPRVRIRGKKGKKHDEPETEGEIPDESEPVFKAVDMEEGGIQLDEILGESPDKIVSGETPQPEVKEDILLDKSDSYKPSPIIEDKVNEVGIDSDEGLQQSFESKDTSVVPSKPVPSESLDVTQRDKDPNQDLLDTIEKVFPNPKRETGEFKVFEKKTTGETKKSVLPKEEMEAALREKLACRYKELKNKAVIIQDLQSDFEKIQRGLESLKNEIDTISEELERQSAVQELETLKKQQQEERKLREEIVKEKRKHDLWMAQTILGDLKKKVEKLEQTHIK